MRQIIVAARLEGWRVYHTFDSRHSEPGFPDLTMTKDGRLVFAELKVAGGRLSAEQKVWGGALQACFGCEYYAWYPSDWPLIVRVLKGLS